MNLLEPKDLKQEREVSLRLKRSMLIQPTASRPPSGAIALLAGAAAFLLTAALMATVKKPGKPVKLNGTSAEKRRTVWPRLPMPSCT